MNCLNAVKACLIYGTDSGNTEEAGELMIKRLEDFGCTVDLYCVDKLEVGIFKSYDFFIMGIPTWDFGGIQGDWEDYEEDLLKLDLSGKVVALYGLGDQHLFSDYFLDAMGWLHERIVQRGAQMVGYWSTEGYAHDASLAELNDGALFCGLALDEDCQSDLSSQRIDQWLKQIMDEYQEIKSESESLAVTLEE